MEGIYSCNISTKIKRDDDSLGGPEQTQKDIYNGDVTKDKMKNKVGQQKEPKSIKETLQ